MKKKAVIASATIALAIGVAGCGSTTSTSTNSSSDDTAVAAAVNNEPTLNEVLDQNSASTRILCENYYSLVNQGWRDADIYDQLDNAGAFDGYGGAGPTFFKAMIRWCYNND